MDLNEVQERLLKDHGRLRIRLSEIEGLATRVIESDGRHAGLLIVRAQDLLAALAEHMRWEDRSLLYVLESSESWNPELSDLLAEEHRSQRIFLSELLDQLQNRRAYPVELATSLLDFAERLTHDMDHEEALFLSPEPGRDDAVDVEYETS